MGGFIFMLVIKLLEWAAVAAAVLTYVEIGPGGESVGAIVDAFHNVMMQVDWSALGAEIIEATKTFVAALMDSTQEAEQIPVETVEAE
ncbi:hypothetical protein [Gilvimarinus chinensis]|uniref:hypothetical protein n=1 Tax=Gilvimarinus chinensis TaxID=396005 RepID=UPI00037FA47A|nr:hypothetical protein [Gilvimarinus chinensis]